MLCGLIDSKVFLLNNLSKMDLAKQKALCEYEKYKVIQDNIYQSDFDVFLEDFEKKYSNN